MFNIKVIVVSVNPLSMKRMNILNHLLATILLPATASTALAAEFTLEFEQESAGVNWSGIVDTTADTLTISDWSVTGDSFYPASTSRPITFNAVSGDADVYDIPDDWDGTLSNWGFLSESAWSNYEWTDAATEATGVKGAAISFDIQDVTPSLAVGLTLDLVPGKDDKSGFVADSFARTYTNDYTYSNEPNGTITATTVRFDAVAVPEPSSAMLLLVGAAGALTRRKR